MGRLVRRTSLAVAHDPRRALVTGLGVAVAAVLLTVFLFRDEAGRDGVRRYPVTEPVSTSVSAVDDDRGRRLPDGADLLAAAMTLIVVGLPAAALLAGMGGMWTQRPRSALALAGTGVYVPSRSPIAAPTILSARDRVAASVAAIASHGSRVTGHRGTSLPGVVAERVSPGVGGRVAAGLADVVLVSGTNGKTTTTRLIVELLERAGKRTVTNRSGANFATGVTAALLANSSEPDDNTGPPIAVLEVDEAALEHVARELPVSVLVTTNIVRDQLDRFGETDELLRRWRRLVDSLTALTTLVVCADDARVTNVATRTVGPLRSYGLLGPPTAGVDPRLTPEFSACPACDGPLEWPWVGLGHLGDYRCRRCGFARPEPWLGVQVLASRGFEGSTLLFRMPAGGELRQVDLSLPGVSSAYNAAAAVAAVSNLGVPVRQAVDALGEVRSPWGRYENIVVDGRNVILALGKNPSSVAELVRIGASTPLDGVVVAVNDNIADGRDASWYWDVDISPLLAGRRYLLTGARRLDLALRLKYAAAERGEFAPPDGVVVAQSIDALDTLVAQTPTDGRILVLATYSAMLQLRSVLAARGLVAPLPA